MAYVQLAFSTLADPETNQLTIGQNKTVTIKVGGCVRCISHNIFPERDSYCGHANRTTPFKSVNHFVRKAEELTLGGLR